MLRSTTSTLKILSPFDNLLIQRRRTEELFDFKYTLECYVPAPKRVVGYFSLPLLIGSQLVGQMDAKVDRKKSIFWIKNLVWESKVRQTKKLQRAFPQSASRLRSLQCLYRYSSRSRFRKENGFCYLGAVKKSYPMTIHSIITELEKNKLVFQQMLEDVPVEMRKWKPAADQWCLLELLCHLYDEEREDFRARTKRTLEHPELPLAPFDPVAWVTERQYMEQDYNQKLIAFLEERTQSISWLKGLKDPDWNHAGQHSSLGPLSAQLFLKNWLVHDFIHIRQIMRLKHAYLKAHSEEDLSYAGNW